MAAILPPGRLPPQYDTSVYGKIPVGPRLLYSFEQQVGVPVDGGNPLLRELSPFNIRLLPPNNEVSPLRVGQAEASASYVNTIGDVAAFAFASETAKAARRARNKRQIERQNAALQSSATATEFSEIYSGRSNRRQIRLADAYTAKDLQNQLDAMAAVPPLTLLLNPNSMQISYANVQSFTNRGRNGFIFQRWGEQQPTLNFSGTTGAFIAGSEPSLNLGQQTTLVPTGYQFAAKRNSAAWQNFLALFHFYRSNGYIYDTLGQTEAHLAVGSVAIDYDQFTYLGHIDSFDFTYDENMPNRVEWNMSFVCFRILSATTGLTPVQSSSRSSGSNEILISYSTVDSEILPLRAPSPSPSYPSRSGSFGSGAASPTTVRIGANGVAVPPDVQNTFSQIPFDLLTPGG